MFALAVIATIILVSIAGWSFVLRRLWQGQPVLLFEGRNRVPWTGIDVLILFTPIILAVLVRIFSVSTGNAIDEAPAEGADVAVQLLQAIAGNAALSCIFVVAAVAFLKIFRKATWQDLGVPHDQWSQHVQLGAIAFCTISPPIFALQGLLTRSYDYDHPLLTLLKEEPTAVAWLLCGVSAVVVAPIYEELMFRVILQGWLEKLINQRSLTSAELTRSETLNEWTSHSDVANPISPTVSQVNSARPNAAEPIYTDVELVDEPAVAQRTAWLPILFSSALFALMHLGQGPAPIPLFFLAIALGYVYQRTHSVVPCILLHALLNGTSLAMLAAATE